MKHSLGLNDYFEDPISFEPIQDAVITPCGHSFSQSTIDNWLQKQSTCPLCNTPLQASSVVPNFALRAAIAKYDQLKQNIERDAENEVRQTIEKFAEANLRLEEEEKKKAIEREKRKIMFEAPKLLVDVYELDSPQLGPFTCFSHENRNSIHCTLKFQDVEKKTGYPRESIWNESFAFNVNTTALEGALLTILLWKKHLLYECCMGQVEIPFENFQQEAKDGKINKWFPLERRSPKDKIPSGRLHLQVLLLGNLS